MTVIRSNPIMHMADEYFSSAIASKHGLLEAVIISKISMFIVSDSRSGQAKRSGDHVFVKCTCSELAAELPFVSINKVRRALDGLIEKGVVKRENLNDCPMSHDGWLTIFDIQLGY